MTDSPTWWWLQQWEHPVSLSCDLLLDSDTAIHYSSPLPAVLMWSTQFLISESIIMSCSSCGVTANSALLLCVPARDWLHCAGWWLRLERAAVHRSRGLSPCLPPSTAIWSPQKWQQCHMSTSASYATRGLGIPAGCVSYIVLYTQITHINLSPHCPHRRLYNLINEVLMQCQVRSQTGTCNPIYRAFITTQTHTHIITTNSALINRAM